MNPGFSGTKCRVKKLLEFQLVLLDKQIYKFLLALVSVLFLCDPDVVFK